jgi:ABC-type transport system involved in multi-copper enzyme maturation permease subunit
VAVPSPSAVPDRDRWAWWGNSTAIAGIVIKEMYRRKDSYVLFILTALLTLVVGSVNFFNEENIVRLVKETCLQLIWISSIVITVTTAARQIPAERENRTIFPLLAKPVTRPQVVLGKFLGCWFACGLTLVAFYTFFVIVSGAREHSWPLVPYFQMLMMHWWMLGILTAMTLLGSVVFAAPSSNITITVIVTAGIFLIARKLNVLALGQPEPMQSLIYAIYFTVPHLALFDLRDYIIHERGVIAWLPWLGAFLYAAVYTAIFLILTCLAFRRKALN